MVLLWRNGLAEHALDFASGRRGKWSKCTHGTYVHNENSCSTRKENTRPVIIARYFQNHLIALPHDRGKSPGESIHKQLVRTYERTHKKNLHFRVLAHVQGIRD